MASGNCADVYMMVSKYWFPDLVLGKGPTQSTNTRLKGSSSPGIVWRGKNGINYNLTNMARLAKFRSILS